MLPANGAFYATCSCRDGRCTCKHDDQHLFSFDFDHLSASQRAEAADEVVQRILDAPFEQQQEFLKQIKLTKRTTPMNTLLSEALQGSATPGVGGFASTKAAQYKKLSDYLRCASIPDRENLLEDVMSMAHELPGRTLRKFGNRFLMAAKAQEHASTGKAARLARCKPLRKAITTRKSKKQPSWQ
jgi:hypothetical protein